MTDEQQPNAPAGNGQTPEGDNPFGGLSLEWTTASPPITENFVRTPIVTKGAYDFNTENT